MTTKGILVCWIQKPAQEHIVQAGPSSKFIVYSALCTAWDACSRSQGKDSSMFQVAMMLQWFGSSFFLSLRAWFFGASFFLKPLYHGFVFCFCVTCLPASSEMIGAEIPRRSIQMCRTSKNPKSLICVALAPWSAGSQTKHLSQR